MSQLPFGKKRIIIAIALLPALVFSANKYLNWSWFGRYDELVAGAAFLPLFLVFFLLNPSEEEIRAYRDERDRQKALKK